jgi:hypothetical protein
MPLRKSPGRTRALLLPIAATPANPPARAPLRANGMPERSRNLSQSKAVLKISRWAVAGGRSPCGEKQAFRPVAVDHSRGTIAAGEVATGPEDHHREPKTGRRAKPESLRNQEGCKNMSVAGSRWPVVGCWTTWCVAWWSVVRGLLLGRGHKLQGGPKTGHRKPKTE